MYVYTPPWGGGGESIIHKNQQNLAQCKVTKSMSPMGCLSPPSPLEWGITLVQYIHKIDIQCITLIYNINQERNISNNTQEPMYRNTDYLHRY